MCVCGCVCTSINRILSALENTDTTYTNVGNITPIEVNFALSSIETRLGSDVMNLKLAPPFA